MDIEVSWHELYISKIQDSGWPPNWKPFLGHITQRPIADFSEILRGKAVFHRISAMGQTRVPQNEFFVFLMQFGLRRPAAFVSSPIHLFSDKVTEMSLGLQVDRGPTGRSWPFGMAQFTSLYRYLDIQLLLESESAIIQGQWKWHCSTNHTRLSNLLVCHYKFSSILYHFRELWRWRISWPWSRGGGQSPCEFMHDLYTAEIFGPGAIIFPLIVWIYLRSFLHNELR